MGLFPVNKISDFKNRLGTVISLPPGRWEVALTGLSYIAGLTYVRQGELLFERWDALNSIRNQEVRSSGDATSIAEFTDILNKALPGSTFSMNKLTATYSIKLKNSQEIIKTTEKIRDLLGLKTINLTCPTTSKRDAAKTISSGVSTYPGFLAAGNTRLFVYCNLVRPQYIADKMAPCHGVVTFSGNTREQKDHEFMHRHYMELAVSGFDIIHMYLMNEMGELAPFEFGNLTITLNFREKNDETPSSIWRISGWANLL